jgi:SAM-dependent methyltransferase
MAAVDPPPARLNAGFDEAPDAYDELRASGHMARRREEHVAALVAATPGPVLELGCGTGTLLRALATRFPDRRFLGVEPLPNYVEYATARAAGLPNVRFAVGTGEELSTVVEPASVGLVLSVDALHHVRDVAEVARQVAAAARPGARWRAIEPNRLHPYVWLYHTLTAGERTFAVRPFLGAAAAAGWRLAARHRLFLYPSGVARVPAWAERLERRWESHPVLSGAVVLDLVREA